jgi:arabinofuranan 3-O-arabinosyltransferase
LSTATEAESRVAPLLPSAVNDTAPLTRRWLCVVAAAALVLTFAQSPGQISPDTKLDLTANPLRFLSRAFNLWNSDLPFGQAQNQAYGYLFPHGTFFLAGDVLGLPDWVIQRLWWALLLVVGFWGLLIRRRACGHEDGQCHGGAQRTQPRTN